MIEAHPSRPREATPYTLRLADGSATFFQGDWIVVVSIALAVGREIGKPREGFGKAGPLNRPAWTTFLRTSDLHNLLLLVCLVLLNRSDFCEGDYAFRIRSTNRTTNTRRDRHVTSILSTTRLFFNTTVIQLGFTSFIPF
jgi:hypothetical protein